MRSLLWTLSLSAVCLFAAGCADTGGGEIKVDNYPTFPTTSDEPVLLRYALKDGQKLTMSIDVDMSMEIDQGRQSVKMKMPMVMEAAANVTAVDKEGNMSMDMKITRMKVTADVRGPQTSKIEFDSNQPGGNPAFEPIRAMINVNLPCKISPTGKTLAADMGPLMQALDRAGNPALTKQMKDTLNQLVESTFVPLSEKPVKVGETYQGGTMNMNGATARVSYKVRSVSGDKKQVVLEPTAELQFGSGAVPGAEIKVTKQAFGGWLLFDLEKGYSSKGEGHISMLVDIKAGGETGTMNMKGKTVVTTKLQ